ncbi:hypothetical protein AB0F13_12055 [Streptomyces sp. NPDC026206]|uniref:hypothetical protein n=1 Tax=Streptomyces sp. NPDC026206 TaxID=3157089 RepID=UPI00340B0898
MKTENSAKPSRKTANPRRTTLTHLKDAETLRRSEALQHAAELPAVTANPRRTVLMTAPAAQLPQD